VISLLKKADSAKATVAILGSLVRWLRLPMVSYLMSEPYCWNKRAWFPLEILAALSSFEDLAARSPSGPEILRSNCQRAADLLGQLDLEWIGHQQ
jgi:hypothetical protein